MRDLHIDSGLLRIRVLCDHSGTNVVWNFPGAHVYELWPTSSLLNEVTAKQSSGDAECQNRGVLTEKELLKCGRQGCYRQR